MATWSSVVNYMKSNYKISDEQPNMLRLLFETEGGRSQVVYLWHTTLLDGAEDWIQIESPFAKVDFTDLRAVLLAAGSMVCGGVTAQDDFLIYRHSVPLAHLDADELERPLILVTGTADRLEKQFTSGDAF